MGRVTELVDRSRLVTLTGPGGTGKTRLAVQAARRLMGSFPDGVFFVDLSSVTDPQLVPDTIGSALKFRQESSGRPVLEILTDNLRDRTMLLVLDNFEQVLPARRPWRPSSEPLPGSAPRHQPRPARPLGRAGAPHPPSRAPRPRRQSRRPPAKRGREAVRRASRVGQSDVLAHGGNGSLRRRDLRSTRWPSSGIELAATRVRVLPVGSLLDQLESRLPMLAGGPRTRRNDSAPSGPPLPGVTTSWEPVRTFFRRLSVFAGGWTLEAGGKVADPGEELGDAFELLEILLEHSLVQRSPDDPEGRIRMLETIREFGQERLEESGEAQEIRQLHAAWFLELAEEAERYLTGPDQGRWLDVLRLEHDNLRAALDWAIGGDRGEIAARLGSALWRFWYARGHLDEGRRWLDQLLSLPSSQERSTPRARAHTALGGIAYWQGDFGTALSAYQEALEIHRQLGDRSATVQALLDLGTAKGVTGDPMSAQSLIQESLTTPRELGDRPGKRGHCGGGARRVCSAAI